MSFPKEIVEHLLVASDLSEGDQDSLRDTLPESISEEHCRELALRVLSSSLKFSKGCGLLSNLEQRVIDGLIKRANIANERPRESKQTTPVASPVAPTASLTPPRRSTSSSDGRSKTQDQKNALTKVSRQQPAPPAAEKFHEKTYPFASKIMMKQGWMPGKGLGVEGQGIKNPIHSPKPPAFMPSNKKPDTKTLPVDDTEEARWKRNHDWSDVGPGATTSVKPVSPQSDLRGAADPWTPQGTNPSVALTLSPKEEDEVVRGWKDFSMRPAVYDAERSAQKKNTTRTGANMKLVKTQEQTKVPFVPQLNDMNQVNRGSRGNGPQAFAPPELGSPAATKTDHGAIEWQQQRDDKGFEDDHKTWSNDRVCPFDQPMTDSEKMHAARGWPRFGW